MKRSLSVLAIVLSLLSACSQAPEPTKENRPTVTLRINIGDDPQALDPRKARTLTSSTLCRMLFEGLTRLNDHDEPELALAESVDISEDRTTYVFTLKEAYWSNGDPITAYDFAYSWTSVLDPLFPAPQAHLMYPIKNAKAAKTQALQSGELGIRALDDRTLYVELELPTPYFLELTALPVYLPINHRVDRKSSSWALKSDPEYFTCSGPFQLDSWRHYDRMVMKKNPNYWDADRVQLDEIHLTMVSAQTAFMMYQQGELDWAGSPLDTLPAEAIPQLQLEDALLSKPASATAWFNINIEQAPFTSEKVRQAFAYAIDRQELVTQLLGGTQQPAYGIVPPSANWPTASYFDGRDSDDIQRLLEEGLQEQNLTRETLPAITLLYATSDRSQKIAEAVQQQWRRTLGVDVQLQNLEKKVFFDHLQQKNFQISIGNWFADINDPIDFLGIFSDKTNGTNNTNWDDAVFANLLEMSRLEKDPAERLHILQLAEKRLMEEMPVIPLFHFSLNFTKKSAVEGVHVSGLGWLDFKAANMHEVLR